MMLEAALGTAKPWGRDKVQSESSTDSSVWYMLLEKPKKTRLKKKRRRRPIKSTDWEQKVFKIFSYLFIKMKEGPHAADLIPRATWPRRNNHQSCFTRWWVTIHAETRRFTISNEISPTSSKYVLFTGSNNFYLSVELIFYPKIAPNRHKMALLIGSSLYIRLPKP